MTAPVAMDAPVAMYPLLQLDPPSSVPLQPAATADDDGLGVDLIFDDINLPPADFLATEFPEENAKLCAEAEATRSVGRKRKEKQNVRYPHMGVNIRPRKRRKCTNAHATEGREDFTSEESVVSADDKGAQGVQVSSGVIAGRTSVKVNEYVDLPKNADRGDDRDCAASTRMSRMQHPARGEIPEPASKCAQTVVASACCDQVSRVGDTSKATGQAPGGPAPGRNPQMRYGGRGHHKRFPNDPRGNFPGPRKATMKRSKQNNRRDRVVSRFGQGRPHVKEEHVVGSFVSPSGAQGLQVEEERLLQEEDRADESEGQVVAENGLDNDVKTEDFDMKTHNQNAIDFHRRNRPRHLSGHASTKQASRSKAGESYQQRKKSEGYRPTLTSSVDEKADGLHLAKEAGAPSVPDRGNDQSSLALRRGTCTCGGTQIVTEALTDVVIPQDQDVSAAVSPEGQKPAGPPPLPASRSHDPNAKYHRTRWHNRARHNDQKEARAAVMQLPKGIVSKKEYIAERQDNSSTFCRNPGRAGGGRGRGSGKRRETGRGSHVAEKVTEMDPPQLTPVDADLPTEKDRQSYRVPVGQSQPAQLAEKTPLLPEASLGSRQDSDEQQHANIQCVDEDKVQLQETVNDYLRKHQAGLGLTSVANGTRRSHENSGRHGVNKRQYKGPRRGRGGYHNVRGRRRGRQ